MDCGIIGGVDYTLVLILGLVAGTLGGVVGFGTSIMLMPALVLVFGPREAVPIMAVASIMANASRVAAWWRELDWRAVGAYSTTAVPAAVLGAATLLVLPARGVEAGLGLFFIAMIPAGSSLVAGAFIARRYVRQIDAERFRLLMDGLLLVAGLTMLWAAATP